MKRVDVDAVAGGLFLIGIGMLFVFHWFFPGILLVIGVVSFAHQALRGQMTNGLTTLVFFGGLTLVLAEGFDWKTIVPVALIGMGLIGLVNAFRHR